VFEDLRKKPALKMHKSFGDTRLAHLLFKIIAPVMESRLRYRFFNPIMSLKAGGVQPGQVILEVGPGTGFFTLPAARLVGDEGLMVAIDPHPLAIEQVVKKVQDARLTNVRLIKSDATRCGLSSASIDLILLYGVIPSPTLPLERLLPEMHRVLRPEGMLAVWTAFPWWSPTSLPKDGLFAYIRKEASVHTFKRITGSSVEAI
jgi:ubiquinone/menaquinone biosynthesis C-methylase UbiE